MLMLARPTKRPVVAAMAAAMLLLLVVVMATIVSSSASSAHARKLVPEWRRATSSSPSSSRLHDRTASHEHSHSRFVHAHAKPSLISVVSDDEKTTPSSHPAAATTASWNITANKALINVSVDLWGAFLEEINHAGVGGLLNEQVNNSNFETRTQDFFPWYVLSPSDATTNLRLSYDYPLNAFNPTSLEAVTRAAGQVQVTIVNPGYWGINTAEATSWTASFWALAVPAQVSSITVWLGKWDGSVIYGSAVTSSAPTSSWSKFSVQLTGVTTIDSNASLFLTWTATSASSSVATNLYLDVVSLRPNTNWNGLTYIRPALADYVSSLRPSFFRFPGGCFVEGDTIADRFNWKRTIGPIENRTGHWNLWGYYSEDYLGYLEYLQFIEQLTDVYGNPTRPIWVVNSGQTTVTSGRYSGLPASRTFGFLQDALDSLEFALGNSSTFYGALRAQLGHPEPFNIPYVAIGNEDCGHDYYTDNYKIFYAALKEAYPNIKLVANCDLTGDGLPTELWDYHTYRQPNDFFGDLRHFDGLSRAGALIFNSEYAVWPTPSFGNVINALSEAAWMIGIERNSDLVVAASYAPLFVNNNDRFWNPDAIVFNSSSTYGTPSYWVQYVFMNSYEGTVSGSVQTVANSLVLGSDSSITAGVVVGTLNAEWAAAKDATVVYIHKIIHWAGSPAPLTISLNDVPSTAVVNPVADVITMTSTSGDLVNTFDDPLAFSPVASTVKLPGLSFTYTLPTYSVTQVRVYVKL